MILNKISIALKVFFNSTFETNLPRNIKLLIFDGESVGELKNIR